MPNLDWNDDASFTLDGVTFVLSVTDRFRSTADRMLLVKTRPFVEWYVGLLDRLRPRHIVELGMWQGGSAAFIFLYAQPETLLGVDLSDVPIAGLEDLRAARGLEGLRLRYGVDQADDERLETLVSEAFGDEDLDLVVDDASHRLGPTRRSFDRLFPRLRPGGAFVIEDWSGLHHYDRVLHEKMASDPGVRKAIDASVRDGGADTPLSVMLFQLVLAAAYAPEVVASVEIADGRATVERGAAPLDPGGFALADLYTPTAARLLVE